MYDFLLFWKLQQKTFHRNPKVAPKTQKFKSTNTQKLKDVFQNQSTNLE